MDETASLTDVAAATTADPDPASAKGRRLMRRLARPEVAPTWGVVVAVVAWFAAGGSLVARGLAARTSIDENSAGYTGDDVVATTLGDPGGTVLLMVGIAVIVMCVALALGLGWSIYPLVLVVVVATVVVALTGSLLTLFLMGCLALGTIPLMSAGSYAYLTGRPAGAFQ